MAKLVHGYTCLYLDLVKSEADKWKCQLITVWGTVAFCLHLDRWHIKQIQCDVVWQQYT